jgi:L-glyceraldehyde 3-phosphate reductase
MPTPPPPPATTTPSFRRCGNSGLVLPAITLGLWQNFGGADVFETGRAMIRRAFDRGVTHFDLANNYGPPYGSAEENFGTILRKDFGLRKHSSALRNELIISTKAGWDMWPGPYGIGASRKYLLASLDDSLRRMGLDYVDIFYAHRPWKDCPLEETMGALVSAVHQGKAHYVGISSYNPERTRQAAKILKQMGVPLLIHQPSYSMFNRWIEKGLLATLDEIGAGCIAFSPLAQGLLTSKYLKGIPKDSRAKSEGSSLMKAFLSEKNLKRARALNDIAQARGPDPRANGHRLGAARQACHLGPHRRAQRRAARRLARRAEEPQVHRRGAQGNRPLRAGRRPRLVARARETME